MNDKSLVPKHPDRLSQDFSEVFDALYMIYWDSQGFSRKLLAYKLGIDPDTITNWRKYGTGKPAREKIIRAGEEMGLTPLGIDTLLLAAKHEAAHSHAGSQAQAFADEAQAFAEMLKKGINQQTQFTYFNHTSPIKEGQPGKETSMEESQFDRPQVRAGRDAYVAQDHAQIRIGTPAIALILVLIIALIIIGVLGYQKIQSNVGIKAIPAPPKSIVYIRNRAEPDINADLDTIESVLLDQRVIEYKEKVNYLSTASRQEVKDFYDGELDAFGWTIEKHEDLKYGLALAYGNPDDEWKISVIYIDLSDYNRDDALILTWIAKKRS